MTIYCQRSQWQAILAVLPDVDVAPCRFAFQLRNAERGVEFVKLAGTELPADFAEALQATGSRIFEVGAA